MTPTNSRIRTPRFLQRLFAPVVARDITVFVVPGIELLRMYGIDLRALPISVAATPRHASVLLVMSPLPDAIAKAAAVVFDQIPGPRAILQIGSDPIPTLPEPDVIASTEPGDMERAVQDLKNLFASGRWSSKSAGVFAATENNHGEHEHQHNSHTEHAGHEMDHGDHSGHDNHNGHGTEMEHGEHQGHEGQGHGNHGGHGGHDHHMHHGDGFMSMIAMTQDLPRSADGLQMDWMESAFGPLFPGLPAGLNLTLTLDGDTVATAQLDPGSTTRGVATSLPMKLTAFTTRMADLDLLAPDAYELLAVRALGMRPSPAMEARRLEVIRAISHLGWLASIGQLLGDAGLTDEATDLQFALVRGHAPASLYDRAMALRNRTRRSFMLKRRLKGLAPLSTVHASYLSGPNIRAMGMPVDERAEESLYRSTDFSSVVYEGGDAWARLNVRLDEVVQSLELADQFSESTAAHDEEADWWEPDTASLETPRGIARLTIWREGNWVMRADVSTPSAAHARLLPDVVEGLELSDALLAIASLDLSPWEIDQ